jgi:membrane protease YdiL (CAAX protease family)
MRYPVLSFYALVFAISWGGLLLLIGPGPIPGAPGDVERLFPLALVTQFAGPSISGILMTGLVSGKAGLRELRARLFRWRVGARWYAAALLTGPLVVAAVLFGLSIVSPAFIPGIVTSDDRVALLLFGLGWGLVGGGFLEELGWTGFAVPELRRRHGIVTTALIVGLLWGAWHFLIAFWAGRALAGDLPLSVFVAGFLAFYALALPAYRVLMVRVYDGTGSLLVVMLMHALLSASTLVLQPETTAGHLTWNLVLAAVLWVIVAAVAVVHRGQLESARAA